LHQYSDVNDSDSIYFAVEPVVTTNDATEITSSSAVLNGFLDFDGGEDCTVWFEYNTTTGYGINTSNQTKNTGDVFKSDVVVRPNADTFESGGTLLEYPNTGDDEYTYIDDVVSDGDATYLHSNANNDFWYSAYIEFQELSGYTNISAISIDIVARVTDIKNNNSWVGLSIQNKTNDNVIIGFEYKYVTNDTEWHNIAFTYTENDTGKPLTQNDLNNGTMRLRAWNGDSSYQTRITQVYMTVDSVSNLSAGQLYHYRAVANNSITTSYGSDKMFLTKPDTPANLFVNNTHHGVCVLNLSWTKGDGANNTYIERNTSSSWSRGEGTLVYNSSGSYFNDTNLTMNTRYYYRAWSYAEWTEGGTTLYQYSDSVVDDNITDNLDPPYAGSSVYNTTIFEVNLSWTRGNNSDREIVVQNNNTWSTSPSDGWVRYNDTDTYINLSINSTGYFTVWSYNDTCNVYSQTGLHIDWGFLLINCYNETPPHISLTYNLLISNNDFSTTYEAVGISGFHYIDLNDIPFGENTIFQVSSDGYETRIQTHDTNPNTFYNFTFYLPIEIPPGGTGDPNYNENISYAEDYIIQVIGPQTQYGADPPIEDALVVVKRYINTTGAYQEVFSGTTDSNGEVGVSLIPGTLYAIKVTHDDYYNATDSWTPTEIVFSDDRYFPVRMIPLPTSGTTEEYDDFWGYITLTGTMINIDGVNGSLLIRYIDSNSSTIDTRIYVYELYAGSSTLIATITNTSENDISYTIGLINATRTHWIVLFFNNTANFDVDSPVEIYVSAINTWSPRTPFDINDRLEPIFGPFSFGWENLIVAMIAIIVLCMFGPTNTGVGLIASGLALGLGNYIVAYFMSNTTNILLVALIPVIIVIAGIYLFVKNPGGNT